MIIFFRWWVSVGKTVKGRWNISPPKPNDNLTRETTFGDPPTYVTESVVSYWNPTDHGALACGVRGTRQRRRWQMERETPKDSTRLNVFLRPLVPVPRGLRPGPGPWRFRTCRRGGEGTRSPPRYRRVGVAQGIRARVGGTRVESPRATGYPRVSHTPCHIPTSTKAPDDMVGRCLGLRLSLSE